MPNSPPQGLFLATSEDYDMARDTADRPEGVLRPWFYMPVQLVKLVVTPAPRRRLAVIATRV